MPITERLVSGEQCQSPVRTMLIDAVGMHSPLRILAVDNEPSVTLSLRFVFSKPRYEVTCVASGAAALARLDANSNGYDVLIVDQKMPHRTGAELVRAAKRTR